MNQDTKKPVFTIKVKSGVKGTKPSLMQGCVK